MNAPLPTVKDLEKLPMRALVAYAARTARRISRELQGIVADDILDHALLLVDSVSTMDPIGKVDQASVIRAAERVAAAYAAAPAGVKSLEKFRVVFSIIHAALAARHTLQAAVDPRDARHQMNRAALATQRAIRPIEALGSKAASATAAARRDYDILLEKYGEQEDVVIGDAIDCFQDA